MKKLIYVLLDGVGDLPNTSLNGLTPLEAAKTPSMDGLARNGIMGTVYTVGKGIAPESDAGVLSMLGYDVSKEYVGRGPIEAIGMGMDFKEGDLAMRANYSTVSQDKKIIDRRAGRNLSSKESRELADAINSEVRLDNDATFQMKASVAHRGVLVISMDGESLSSDISNTDPAYKQHGGLGVASSSTSNLVLERAEPLSNNPSSKLSAMLVNEFTKKSAKILSNHPVNEKRESEGKRAANLILLRDAGNRIPSFVPISKKYGMNFASLTNMPVEKGITSVTGMTNIDSAGLDQHNIAELVEKILPEYEAIYVHIKGPDEPGHDGDAILKKKVIEDVDEKFFGYLRQRIDMNDIVIAISADHSTPCTMKAHSDHPVPLLISGGNIKKDSSCRYTEREGQSGKLGSMKGIDVLEKIVSLTRD